MNKLRVQNTNIANNIKPVLKVPIKSSANTTLSTTTTTTNTTKAVLSIEINQDMASSLDNHCMISQENLQGAKKKRPALESLSTNVNYSQTSK